VRHILVKAEADEEGNYSDEAKEAAKARAEEILAEFESGDKTEERFAELAEQYSEDTGSNTNGGLYENVAKGQMVQEFNDFCYAEHKAGDTGIVYGESASYAGYHVMYYVGEGELNSNVIAETALRNEDADAWMEKQEEANPSKDGFGMKFVG
jgi:parvulin-like peptidyl-prolyl isomerase